ncbi:MAG: hypothetical protein HZC43_08255 [Nitrosomonadales bacterium]|nr:hypothetical protein [Nitrosomonadales bacterium]
MRTVQLWLKQITKLGLILMMGASMSVDAGLFGFGGDSWKEEVLLHDGQKIIAQRSLSYGGRREVGQGAPIKEQNILFTLPNANKTIKWTSEYSEDVGRANFNLLAVHVLDDTPYVVAEPNLCLSYNKWGRPNPPYVFFKYDGKEWRRIPLSALPVEFKTLNVAIYLGHQDVDLMVEEGLVPAETIKRRNEKLLHNYPQYKTILREAYAGAAGGCDEMVYYKGAWVGPGDSIGKRMMDSKSK